MAHKTLRQFSYADRVDRLNRFPQDVRSSHYGEDVVSLLLRRYSGMRARVLRIVLSALLVGAAVLTPTGLAAQETTDTDSRLEGIFVGFSAV